jgi:hypothetical protein
MTLISILSCCPLFLLHITVKKSSVGQAGSSGRYSSIRYSYAMSVVLAHKFLKRSSALICCVGYIPIIQANVAFGI